MELRRARKKVEYAGFLTAVILFLSMSAVVEGACREDALANVKGATLVTSSGDVYRVGSPNIDIAFWLPPARIIICDRIAMNGDYYYAISNKDSNQTVRAAKLINKISGGNSSTESSG